MASEWFPTRLQGWPQQLLTLDDLKTLSEQILSQVNTSKSCKRKEPDSEAPSHYSSLQTGLGPDSLANSGQKRETRT